MVALTIQTCTNCQILRHIVMSKTIDLMWSCLPPSKNHRNLSSDCWINQILKNKIYVFKPTLCPHHWVWDIFSAKKKGFYWVPLGEFLPVQAPETASPSCFLYRLKLKWGCIGGAPGGLGTCRKKKNVRTVVLNQTKNPFGPVSPAAADSPCLGKSRIGQAYSNILPFYCPSFQGFIVQELPNPEVVSLYLRKWKQLN